MKNTLSISVGQYSEKGRKSVNQDFHGVYIPDEPALSSKGIAVAIADGIGSSDVSQIASELAVKGFLTDYYCTSDSWSVKSAVQRVLLAINSWLYAQTQRSEYRLNKDKGYISTFSGMIIKSATAHLFHIGDARIYRVGGDSLECLTEEHRVWASKDTHYLSRALGIHQQVDIDYKTVQLDIGDTFILITDGIYEYLNDTAIIEIIAQSSDDLNSAAKKITQQAYEQGSDDNLTAQVIRIDNLPDKNVGELYQHLTVLPFPPMLKPRMQFDGYDIVRDIYSSSRSHVFLAKDSDTNEHVVIKIPSVDLRDDKVYLERFLMEEWIANRLDSAHVMKALPQKRQRNYLYTVTEFIEGQTLKQWMVDNPKPSLEQVRNIIEQVAKGLQAFHRQEMLHQDLRPNNIIIDQSGTVKIIDFGSTYVAGLVEIESPLQRHEILGTALFTAPEYFIGEWGTRRSDLYSLAVIAYQMLSGDVPYGPDVAKARTKAAQNKLRYRSVLADDREVPTWLDETLKKAVHPNPEKRYQELSEFVYDLRHPNRRFIHRHRSPLLERNPVLFWQVVSLFLFIIIIYLSVRL